MFQCKQFFYGTIDALFRQSAASDGSFDFRYGRFDVRADEHNICTGQQGLDHSFSRRVVIGDAIHIQTVCDNQSVKSETVHKNSSKDGLIHRGGPSVGLTDSRIGDVSCHDALYPRIHGSAKRFNFEVHQPAEIMPYHRKFEV